MIKIQRIPRNKSSHENHPRIILIRSLHLTELIFPCCLKCLPSPGNHVNRFWHAINYGKITPRWHKHSTHTRPYVPKVGENTFTSRHTKRQKESQVSKNTFPPHKQLRAAHTSGIRKYSLWERETKVHFSSKRVSWARRNALAYKSTRRATFQGGGGEGQRAVPAII